MMMMGREEGREVGGEDVVVVEEAGEAPAAPATVTLLRLGDSHI